MEKLQHNYALEITWHSFMLRPPGTPPMSPAYLARIEASCPMMEKKAREEYGVEINPGPFALDSRYALIAQKFAAEHGKGNEFHEAVMRAYWQEARSIDDKEVLKAIAAAIGLPTEHFNDDLERPEYETAVLDDFNKAQEYGLQGVPALVFAEKYLVSGAQPYEILKRVVEKIQQEEG